jgi:hypothetical protein
MYINIWETIFATSRMDDKHVLQLHNILMEIHINVSITNM